MLRAGFCKLEISPGRDVSLLGYDFRQKELPPGNDGVHDPLYARVLVLHDGNKPAAIISLDLAILLVPLARHLRQRVAEKLGTTIDRVLLTTTHTHSGPFPLREEDGKDHGFLSSFVEQRGDGARNPDVVYAEYLESRLLDAAARAGGFLLPVTIESQQAPLGIAYVRRHRGADGKVHMVWSPQEAARFDQPKAKRGVVGTGTPLVPSHDQNCTVIVLKQTNGPRRFVLWSVGAHPTTLGKTSRVVSADWPGLACQQIDADAPHTYSMFLQGPCGDTHAWVATQEATAGLEPVATAASAMVRLLMHATHRNDDRLDIAAKTVRFGQHELDLAALRLGNVMIAGAPVELFSALGAELRKKLDAPHTIVSTMTNGWVGYWPTRAAFREGEYEINAAKAMGRKPGDSEKLIAALATLAKMRN